VYRDNPYSNTLLLAPRASGWTVLESAHLDRLEADLRRLGPGDVFHMHWTAPIVQRAEDAAEARSRLDRFRRAVTDARESGAQLVWTIHNVLPHDARHLDLEIELNRFLASTADAVHVLSAGTGSVTSEFYELDPDKVVHIPHPSYQGVYDTTTNRDDARRSLGLADDELAVLFFGQIRPYKGVDTLIAAVGGLDADRATALLLAGRTSLDDEAAIDTLVPEGLHAVRHHAYVDDGDVERWFRASDVVVLPYRRVLNSGTLHLAATYGRPVLLPDEPHLRAEFAGEDWIGWFAPGDSASLRDALRRPLPDQASTAAFTRRHSPYETSRKYAALLDDLHLRAARTPSRR
jgi:glycosyltransferase involved in cell wall biosynthesis